MAIINNIKGTISKTGKAAAKKTKDIAGIAKLTADIEETKSLIKGVYVEIGKKYCEHHTKENADDIFTVDVATVENLTEQLENLKAKRMKLRGKILCEKCGKAVDNEYTFCPFCGEKLPEEAETVEGCDIDIDDIDEDIDDED